MLNITEKIQQSAEEFREKFVCNYGSKKYEQSLECFSKPDVDEVVNYIITSQKEITKSIIEEIEKAGEQVRGGGNGRRILIQLIGELEEST